MSPNSTVVPPASRRDSDKVPPRVVIVKPDSSALDYHGLYDSDKDGDKLKKSGLAVIQNSTEISFSFNGTGVAVVAMQHSFPPIPNRLQPRWSCSVDGIPTDNKPPEPSTQPLSDSSMQIIEGSIPADSNHRVCQVRQLLPGLHELKIDIQIIALPAYLHSIRYKPLGVGAVPNAILRIDAKDPTAMHYDPRCWRHGHDDPLEYKCEPGSNGTMTITFSGQSLDWFGSGLSDKTKLNMTLDGKEYHLKDHHGSGNPDALFTVSADNQTATNHTLTISPSHEGLTLDHFLVKAGKPVLVQLGDNSTQTPSPSPSSNPGGFINKTTTIIGTILAVIIGTIIVGLIGYFVTRRLRGRRKRNSWKDSALPPAIMYPASRVSSPSSFNREVVTGDIEYNPEAEKKLGGANMTSDTPATFIVHADSGVRYHQPASEIPPRYSQV